jgi:hypothetical protein
MDRRSTNGEDYILGQYRSHYHMQCVLAVPQNAPHFTVFIRVDKKWGEAKLRTNLSDNTQNTPQVFVQRLQN